jgi:glutamyl-tRNA(Gln) amidotransferase subunit D
VDYSDGKITINSEYTKRGERTLELTDTMQPRCALVKFTPAADPTILSWYIDAGYRGIVIEGTGLGHVSTDWIPEIKRATKGNIPVIITSQCINGRICDRVYDTGMDMTRAGAIEAGDMLPEVALVKLMWVLGQTDDMNRVKELIQSPVSHEIAYRSLR